MRKVSQRAAGYPRGSTYPIVEASSSENHTLCLGPGAFEYWVLGLSGSVLLGMESWETLQGSRMVIPKAQPLKTWATAPWP